MAKLLNCHELAELLSVTTGAVRIWQRKGIVKHVSEGGAGRAKLFDLNQVMLAITQHDIKLSVTTLSRIGEFSTITTGERSMNRLPLRTARPEFLRQWAKDPATLPVDLGILAYEQDDETRQHAAGNPSTTVLHLMKLASDCDPSVRRAVHENPNTPEIVREMIPNFRV